MTRWIAVASLALASPAAAMTVSQADPAATEEAGEARAVARALSDMSAGRHDAGLARLDPILAAYAKRYAGETRTIVCAGSAEEALAALTIAAAAKRAAVAIPPGWCGAIFVKGFILVDAQRYDEGRTLIERAVAMRPTSAHYRNELGYVLGKQGQWQASHDAHAAAFESAMLADGPERQAGEKGRALRGMGFALIELARWDEAEAKFKECLTLDPNDAKAKNELRYIEQNRPKAT